MGRLARWNSSFCDPPGGRGPPGPATASVRLEVACGKLSARPDTRPGDLTILDGRSAAPPPRGCDEHTYRPAQPPGALARLPSLMRKVLMAPNPFFRSRTRVGRLEFLAWIALAAIGGLAGSAQGQTPTLPAARLFAIFPAGGKQGTTFDVSIVGADLDDARQLHFAEPGITAPRRWASPGWARPGRSRLPASSP